MWVKILDNVELRCVRNAKASRKFKYEKKVDDTIEILCQEDNSPTETSFQSQLHKFLKKTLDGEVGANHIDARIISIKNELEQGIEEEFVDNSEDIISQNEIEAKYQGLYIDFMFYREKYGLTSWELIVAVSHCLGVGSPREIIRAFLGYFQTVSGVKASNVIAIGSPSGGKSFVLESALDMIPDEFVHTGVKSVPYFYRKYNHQDLTGHIFYLSDLGGEKDDEDTMKLRDLLKILNTDGYVERGVVENTGKEFEEEEQWVEGHPCVSYTTAVEKMVNQQERSRGIVLTPPLVDSHLFGIFLTVMDNHGRFEKEITELFRIRDSVKGLVYNFNPEDYDFFNPYMFCVQPLIEGSDDYTRKIQEYNAILKMVTILDNPSFITHDMYFDEDLNKKETRIFIASKRDNINALNIFDGANLLPDEIRFANGLLSEYEPFDIGLVDDDALWEDQVYEWLQEDENAINLEDGRLNISYEPFKKKWFTLKSLKQTHRQKSWFKKSKGYINERIKTLLDEGIIVNVGKDTKNNHNVFILNRGLGDSVEDTLPQFKKSDVDMATRLFECMYPEQIEEYNQFLESDKTYESASTFEVVKPIVPNLPYLEGVDL